MPLSLGRALVADEAMETIVRGAVETVPGAHLETPGRVARVLPGRHGPVEWEVAGSTASFDLELQADFGRVLPDLAAAVRAAVAEHVGRMTGLDVRSVAVTVTEVVREDGHR